MDQGPTNGPMVSGHLVAGKWKSSLSNKQSEKSEGLVTWMEPPEEVLLNFTKNGKNIMVEIYLFYVSLARSKSESEVSVF